MAARPAAVAGAKIVSVYDLPVINAPAASEDMSIRPPMRALAPALAASCRTSRAMPASQSADMLGRLAGTRTGPWGPPARSLSTASAANTLLASWGSTRMAHFFESVNPVLTPEQRSALAQSLRQHMSHQEGQDGP